VEVEVQLEQGGEQEQEQEQGRGREREREQQVRGVLRQVAAAAAVAAVAAEEEAAVAFASLYMLEAEKPAYTVPKSTRDEGEEEVRHRLPWSGYQCRVDSCMVN
jgi:hypothetical protein